MIGDRYHGGSTGPIEELYTFNHEVKKGRALEKTKGQHAPGDIKNQVSPSVITGRWRLELLAAFFPFFFLETACFLFSPCSNTYLFLNSRVRVPVPGSNITSSHVNFFYHCKSKSLVTWLIYSFYSHFTEYCMHIRDPKLNLNKKLDWKVLDLFQYYDFGWRHFSVRSSHFENSKIY